MKPFDAALALLLILLSSWVFRQGEPDFPYRFSTEIEATFKKDTTNGRIDMAAYSFSYIGEYQQALAYFAEYGQVRQPLAPADSLHFLNFKPVDAREYILQRARNEQIVILNEAHHTPIHRVFTSTLLNDLRRLGFRYFGAETLSHLDSLLNGRKYPVLQSGYYTKEPQYGNLIREALRLGYRLFPYEAATPEEFATGKTREIAQARYIEKVLKKDPNAKIVLHCGYAHVYDVPLKSNWEKAMAGRLKEFTGIDPLTIDQQQWTELGDRAKEPPLYRLMNITKPTVYINETVQVYPATSDAKTDIQVVHPRTTYQHGRPVWLFRDGDWRPYFLKKEQLTLGFPCLVLAYRAGENIGKAKPTNQAVPMDVIELKSAADKKALALPPGQYQVVVQSQDGREQQFRMLHGN